MDSRGLAVVELLPSDQWVSALHYEMTTMCSMSNLKRNWNHKITKSTPENGLLLFMETTLDTSAAIRQQGQVPPTHTPASRLKRGLQCPEWTTQESAPITDRKVRYSRHADDAKNKNYPAAA